MSEKEKSQLIAEAENIEALRDFFISWWSVEELYETMAKVGNTLLWVMQRHDLCDESKKELQDLMQQHMMMIEHMKPFAKKDEPEQ